MKIMRKIPFSPPDVGELEIKYVTEAIQSGWITTGRRVKKLERLIADYVGVRRCICLNSQTACGEMSLRILGIGSLSDGIDGICGNAEDEVITCAYTYTASASVIRHVGAKIILVDCCRDSLEIDYDAVENAITENTKAIIPIDLGGVPCDYDRLLEIVERKKSLFRPNNGIQKAIGRVAIVSDGAHAIGATYKGKPVAVSADFVNYSFHAVKNFTTGEGGAMAWKTIDGIDDEEIYKYTQLYSLHGQSTDALAKTQMGSWEYDIIGTWYKSNMTDITAAIGLAQFERYTSLLARRKEIIEKYDAAFRPLGVEFLPHFTDEHISSGHLYITRIPGISREQANEIIEKMSERGIVTNVHYKPLPMFTAYKNLGFEISDYPNAYAMYEKTLTLPLHTKLTDEDVEYIIENYVEVLKEYLNV